MPRVAVVVALSCVFLFSQIRDSSAQVANLQRPSSPELQLGTPIEQTIAPGQQQTYTVAMESGQYIQLVVDQRGIDVVVRLLSPEQKKLGEFDSPNGNDGPENVSVVADTTGTYTIIVTPLNQFEDTKPGRYEIKILELRRATEQELHTLTDREALKTKGIALARETADALPAIRSVSGRVHAQLQAANLLWDSDQKLATKLLTDAVAAIKEYLGSIDPSDPDSFQRIQAAMALRYELIQILSPRDPDLALGFLRSTRFTGDPENDRDNGRLVQEQQIELSLASQIAAKDPKRSFQIAEDNLKKGLSGNLHSTVMLLQAEDPELAASLAKDIAAKLMGENLVKNGEASQLAVNLLLTARSGRVRRQQARGGRDENMSQPLLSDQDSRDLLQKILSDMMSYSPTPASPGWNEREQVLNILNSLKSLGPELERLLPTSAATIEKQTTQLQGTLDPQRAVWQKFQEKVNSSPEAALESLDKAPVEIRDQMYQQVAERFAMSGDLARAKQMISEKILNPFQRRQALQNLDQQSIYNVIRRGKIEEAIRILSALKPARARAIMVAQIANQIGPGQKRAAALNSLELVRNLLGESVRANNQDEMQALLEIAGAFARYDSKRAFEILDPLIDQFNDLTAAARTLSGFGQDYYADDELMTANGNSIANVATEISRAVGRLSAHDFDRARESADKILSPEVRLMVHLGIAQQVIQPQDR